MKNHIKNAYIKSLLGLAEYKNEKEIILSRGVFSDRVLKTIEFIDNSSSHYVKRYYYDNGNKSYESYYIDGKSEGPYREWDRRGRLELVWNYRDGLQHGISRSWRSNGMLDEESFYFEDDRHGSFKRWNSRGELYRHLVYSHGKIIKTWKEISLPMAGI